MRYFIAFFHIWKTMGMKYILFRIYYELSKKTGFLKRKFPTTYSPLPFVDLHTWKNKYLQNFFFSSRSEIKFSPSWLERDQNVIDKMKINHYNYFNSGNFYQFSDWNIHPTSGYKYPLIHWTEIPFFDVNRGDIKFVWENSKFSFIHYYIRSDISNKTNNAGFVIEKIINWIESNPINLGPQYCCSQEISIRILNWATALFFYSESEELTNEKLNIILNSIFFQVEHVESNILFSRIAVKNNHAVTETLCLFLVGMIFPFFPKSHYWLTKGKLMFEEEVREQIMLDGSDNQYSFNYLKVKLQLYSWAIFLAQRNNIFINSDSLQKIKTTVCFYKDFVTYNGRIPNYGANDGSLYFRLNSCDQDDIRAILLPLCYYFNLPIHFQIESIHYDDLCFYTGMKVSDFDFKTVFPNNIINYSVSGYYGLNLNETMIMIRMGNHLFRPSHSDNGHIDWWYNGNNLLRDSGTFMYLSNPDLSQYFSGIKGHNTVSINGEEQMQRGPGFVWYNWTSGGLNSQDFDGTVYSFSGFYKYKSKNGWVVVNRSIIYEITQRKLIVKDDISGSPNTPITQYWHPNPKFENQLSMRVEGKTKVIRSKGWYSNLYGIKEDAVLIEVHGGSPITTIFQLN
jgi:hypothetical protein